MSPGTPNFPPATQDVMVVGEPSVMGGEFGDEDERVITRLENNQYDSSAVPTNGLDDVDFVPGLGGPTNNQAPPPNQQSQQPPIGASSNQQNQQQLNQPPPNQPGNQQQWAQPGVNGNNSNGQPQSIQNNNGLSNPPSNEDKKEISQ